MFTKMFRVKTSRRLSGNPFLFALTAALPPPVSCPLCSEGEGRAQLLIEDTPGPVPESAREDRGRLVTPLPLHSQTRGTGSLCPQFTLLVLEASLNTGVGSSARGGCTQAMSDLTHLGLCSLPRLQGTCCLWASASGGSSARLVPTLACRAPSHLPASGERGAVCLTDAQLCMWRIRIVSVQQQLCPSAVSRC